MAAVTAELKLRLQRLITHLAARGLFNVPREQWEALLGPDEVLPLRDFNKRACLPARPPA